MTYRMNEESIFLAEGTTNAKVRKYRFGVVKKNREEAAGLSAVSGHTAAGV